MSFPDLTSDGPQTWRLGLQELRQTGAHSDQPRSNGGTDLHGGNLSFIKNIVGDQ